MFEIRDLDEAVTAEPGIRLAIGEQPLQPRGTLAAVKSGFQLSFREDDLPIGID